MITLTGNMLSSTIEEKKPLLIPQKHVMRMQILFIQFWNSNFFKTRYKKITLKADYLKCYFKLYRGKYILLGEEKKKIKENIVFKKSENGFKYLSRVKRTIIVINRNRSKITQFFILIFFKVINNIGIMVLN